MTLFTALSRGFTIQLIRWYQRTLSFDHGWPRRFFPYGYCKFHPTCSEYAVQAVTKYGLIRGGLMSVWRVVRCNPWSAGGVDPVV